MEQNQKNAWLVVFGVGDCRSSHYGWMVFWKDEATRTEAKKAGDRSAKRMGENSYNYYYFANKTYVTDSISAFMKKCQKVGLNSSRECLKEYGFEID